MKRILFIAPSSYLINGPEAMVNAKHLFLLSKAGYSVDLICRGVRNIGNIYPTQKGVPFYFAGLNSLKVITVDTKWNIRTLFRHLLSFLKSGYVYKASDWSLEAIRYCEDKLDLKAYDFVLTKDYPSEIVGVFLSKKYGMKWIPTWNDPYMWKKYPSPYGLGPNYKVNFIRRKLIRDIGKYSYLNLFPSARLRDYMLSYMEGMQRNRCVIMPHILLDAPSMNKTRKSGNILRMIYAGSIGKERNPMTFFRALHKFLNDYPNKQIEVTFLAAIQGEFREFINNNIKELYLDKVIHFMNPVSYEDSFKIVDGFDLCLIIEASCKEGIFLPSKLIDYLQNGKVIFTISPKEGVLSDLYNQGIVDYFADVLDEGCIYSSLIKIYDDFISNNIVRKKDLHEFELSTIISLHKNVILK